MNDRQIELILQICAEQIEEYLSDKMTEECMSGIKEGINDNLWMLEEMAEES